MYTMTGSTVCLEQPADADVFVAAGAITTRQAAAAVDAMVRSCLGVAQGIRDARNQILSSRFCMESIWWSRT